MAYRLTVQRDRSIEASRPRVIGAIARANTLGLAEAIEGAQEMMRDEVLAAGLGDGLAKALRKSVYPGPESGKFSMSPAGMVYATPGKSGGRTAEAILGHFERGTPILPALGQGLAIPTDKVPRSKARGKTSAMTPREVEVEFGRRLARVKLKSGHIGLFMVLGSGRRRRSELMFVVVRNVPGNKKIELEAIFEQWGARLNGLIAANFDIEAVK